jgi:hypothetical protein
LTIKKELSMAIDDRANHNLLYVVSLTDL